MSGVTGPYTFSIFNFVSVFVFWPFIWVVLLDISAVYVRESWINLHFYTDITMILIIFIDFCSCKFGWFSLLRRQPRMYQCSSGVCVGRILHYWGYHCHSLLFFFNLTADMTHTCSRLKLHWRRFRQIDRNIVCCMYIKFWVMLRVALYYVNLDYWQLTFLC